MKKFQLFGWLTVVGFLAVPGWAQELKLKAPVTPKSSVKLNEKRARDAVNGYYDALIKGQYDQAGSFAHADAIEPQRKRLLEALKRAPAAQRTATLRNLGVADVVTLQSQTTAEFFASYARSTYGAKLQTLALPERKARINITGVRCESDKAICEVTFDFFQTVDQNGEAFATNRVRVVKVDGRWLVGQGLAR